MTPAPSSTQGPKSETRITLPKPSTKKVDEGTHHGKPHLEPPRRKYCVGPGKSWIVSGRGIFR